VICPRRRKLNPFPGFAIQVPPAAGFNEILQRGTRTNAPNEGFIEASSIAGALALAKSMVLVARNVYEATGRSEDGSGPSE